MLHDLAAQLITAPGRAPAVDEVALTQLWCCVAVASDASAVCAVTGVVGARGADAGVALGDRALHVSELGSRRGERHAAARSWVVAARELVPLGEDTDAPLAPLAAALACAQRRIEALPRPIAGLELRSYGLLNALLHLDLLRRDLQTDVLVVEDSPVRRGLAQANGARVEGGDAERIARTRVAEPELAVPTRAELHTALTALDEQRWRYRPLLTHALLPEEIAGDTGGDGPDGIAVLLRVPAMTAAAGDGRSLTHS